ncbi:MAG: glutamine synthetase [Leptospiraceae bacterium]|nr:glutamine synthetase [Leptospiraceae bacterium]MCP5493440.1 glutamine synthetase [Leptospiraceae bacterium]
MNKNVEQIIQEIKDSGTQKVKVAVTDIDGVLLGKYIHIDKFYSALKSGFGFCNVIFGWDCKDEAYDNATYTGWHTGFPDAVAKIDLNTYRKIPWDKDAPFFLADFEKEGGSPLEVCPRKLLKKIVQKANSLGFQPFCGMEFEFFNFRETPESLEKKSYSNLDTITPGMFGYSIIRSTANQPYFSSIIDELNSFGVPIEGLHTETGPGVFEAGIFYSEALEAADRGVLFKTGVKEISSRYGIIPTFMARWNPKLPGSSGHIHQSLWDGDAKTNLFYDPNDKNKMSSTFKSYLAGQMKCLPELLPFFAPTINSYKRLVEGYWAPTLVTWGLDNRTVAYRIIAMGEKSTRVEVRVGGADINPYLAIAASLASGLYGIEKNLSLEDEPVKGNGYAAKNATRLSRNLYEATEKLSQSEIAREILGKEFVEHFVSSRLWEWREYQKSVTSWELERYFEII